MVTFILDLQPRRHLTAEHRPELNMLRVPDRAQQLTLNTTHKIYYHQAPQYLKTNFKKAQDRTQHTRNSQWAFVVPDAKGNESNTFCFNGIKDWNSLPNDLKTCENICSLKKEVKTHLLQMATDEAGRDFFYSFRPTTI